MTGILIKWGNLDSDSHTGRIPCEDEGGEQGDASTGTPKTASKIPEAQGGACNRRSLTVPPPHPHLDLGLVASRAGGD